MKTSGVIFFLSLLTLFSISNPSAAATAEFELSPLLYPARPETEKTAVLERGHSICLTDASLETARGALLRIDIETPDALYRPLPVDLSGSVLIFTQIFLNAFRLDLLPGISAKLEEIAQKGTFEELSILQCSSIKFNRLFPTIRDLFQKKKVHKLIYTADADGIQTPAAARRGMEELLGSSAAQRVTVPSGTPGREGFAIVQEKPRVQVKNVRDFFSEAGKQLAQTEADRVSKEYQTEISDFELTRTTAFIRLPDEIAAIRHKFEDFSEEKKSVIRVISFADTSLDNSTLAESLDLLLSLPKLKILDLSSVSITEDSYFAVKRILTQESIVFVNITMTELVEKLFEDDGFVQYLGENIDHIKKLIWLPLEERDLIPQIAKLEEKYREVVERTHRKVYRISKVLDYLEQRRETQEMTRQILGSE